MDNNSEIPKSQESLTDLNKQPVNSENPHNGSAANRGRTFKRRTVLATLLGLAVSKKLPETFQPKHGSSRGKASGLLIHHDDSAYRFPPSETAPIATPNQMSSREKTKEYPTDILTEQELKDLHINIISTNKDIELLIRKEALNSDPLMKRLVEIKNRYEADPNNPVLKVNVILSDTDDLFKDDAPIPSEYRKNWRTIVDKLKARGAKGSLGGMFSPWMEWSDDPGWDIKDKKTNKILRGVEAKHETYYIFLAIGKGQRPRPDQSFISPYQLNPSDPAVVSDEKGWTSKTKNLSI